MPAPFRPSLFQITDEEPLEAYPLEDTPSVEEPRHGPGAAEDDTTVGSRHAAEAPAERNAPRIRSLPGSKVAYTGAIAALATGLVATLHVLGDSGEPDGPAGDRANIPSATPRIRRAQPEAPRTPRERAPRRARGRDSRRVDHAEPRPLPQIEVVSPAAVPPPVAAPVSPVLPVLPGPSVAPVARVLGQEFGIER